MRPRDLKARIFLDGADPGETRSLLGLLGFLDGQTTNPTLLSRSPAARARLAQGRRFDETELLGLYRGVVREIAGLLPAGSVSVEVYADASTPAEAMLRQGRAMSGWIPNAHIKFPTCAEGLQAAQQAVREGLRVNLTLCFSQQQAAAVYAATRGAKKGQVFVSPFVGRLDDRGQDGMDLVAHADPGLSPIPYEDVDLALDWREYDLRHELTDKGLERFSSDWNALSAGDREKAAS